jgi:hypothetical protein
MAFVYFEFILNRLKAPFLPPVVAMCTSMIILHRLQKASHYFLPLPLAHKVLRRIAFIVTSPLLGKPIMLPHKSSIVNLTVK